MPWLRIAARLISLLLHGPKRMADGRRYWMPSGKRQRGWPCNPAAVLAGRGGPPASLASLGSQTLWPSNCAGRGAQLRPCASGASATPVLLPAPSGCSQARQADGDLANRSPWHPSTSPNDSALRGNIPGAKGGPRQVRPCCPPQSRRQVLSWTAGRPRHGAGREEQKREMEGAARSIAAEPS